MAYNLRYHPKVRKIDIPKLDQKIKATIKGAIEKRLCTHPDRYGKPLQRTLKGYWKLRIGDYRVVYRIRQEEIQILAIAHRKEVYQRVKMRDHEF
jgi:mRNA interferase RelE/StbE